MAHSMGQTAQTQNTNRSFQNSTILMAHNTTDRQTDKVLTLAKVSVRNGEGTTHRPITSRILMAQNTRQTDRETERRTDRALTLAKLSTGNEEGTNTHANQQQNFDGPEAEKYRKISNYNPSVNTHTHTHTHTPTHPYLFIQIMPNPQ